MKTTFLIPALLALTISFTAHATRKPDHCKPEPKPRDPPAVSKPEPKALTRASRDEGSRSADTLCSRWPTLPLCTQP